MTDVATQVDGRRLRREQNRESVVDALVELFEEGDYTPSSATIAARAGISPRSLFRYFDDVDDLNRAVVQRELDAARPLLELNISTADTPDPKVRGLVAPRLRLRETTAAAARAARLSAHRRPVVARQVS